MRGNETRLRLCCSCGGAILALFLVAGCASRASVPPEATNDLALLRTEAQMANAQIEKTTDALEDLTTKPQQDLKPQYKRFALELTELLRVEANATAQREATEAQITGHFGKWSDRIKAFETAEMRELGAERHAASMQSFKELQDKINSLRSAYQPFAKDLRDIKSFLAADLTTDGLAGIKQVTDRALEAKKVILARLSAVVSQLDALMKTS